LAKIIEVGDELILSLSFFEKLGAFHTSIRAPRDSLNSVTVMENPWSRADGMQGVRAPGTGIPMVVMLGTLRRKGSKDFAAVYMRGPAKVYEFSSGPFKRWIVSVNDSQ
jgi:hypothetical protein